MLLFLYLYSHQTNWHRHLKPNAWLTSTLWKSYKVTSCWLLVWFSYLTMHGPMNIKSTLWSMSDNLVSSCTTRSKLLFVFGATPRASWFTRFLYHTQRRTIVGRTPLDEWSASCRDLYLRAHNRQTFMSQVGFEPTISAGERQQNLALDRAAAGTDSAVTSGHSYVNIFYDSHHKCHLFPFTKSING